MTECKCEKIREIIGGEGEEYAREHLKKICVVVEKWEILYKCPTTDRYWKKYYPNEGQGGGPPDFIQISREEARKMLQVQKSSQENTRVHKSI